MHRTESSFALTKCSSASILLKSLAGRGRRGGLVGLRNGSVAARLRGLRSEGFGEVDRRRTRGTDRWRSVPRGAPWLLVGSIGAFLLTFFVPPMAAAAGLVLVTVALVRRRADAYGMFTVGFVIWCAAYAVLVVIALLAAGSSSGSSTAEDYGAVPSEVVVRELVRPGDVPEPPPIKVFGEGITMDLPIWTRCWLASIAFDGTREHYCPSPACQASRRSTRRVAPREPSPNVLHCGERLDPEPSASRLG